MASSKQRQLKFVEVFTEVLIERLRMLYDIWFTDKSHFWMNGNTNKQNVFMV